MEIVWYGQSCFRLRDKGVTVVTDPYPKEVGLRLPRLSADVVTISHPHKGHSCVEAVKGQYFVVDGPGEYEIRGLFITGIAMFHDSAGGRERGRNTIYIFEFPSAVVCHAGDLGHVPTQAQVEEIGHVDVLLLPVGGRYTINGKQAAEVVSLLEPSIVVPMHYALPGLTVELDGPELFLREMGVKEAQTRDSLSIAREGLPEETEVVILEPKTS
jgi:L-ascorbate metabolism protein UlaG (beta-lactamase superfamily)